MLNKKSKQYIVIIISLIIIVLLFLKSFILIIPNEKIENVMKFGIIDGNISEKHKNIICYNKMQKYKEETHGDYVLDFLSKYAPNTNYYYYDAETEEGYTSDTIIDGLEWMLKNGVNCVSISLSSKYYSSELEKWIQENKDCVTVYASYNNNISSLDYPAMYEDVIGIGASSKIQKKKNDVIFHSNKAFLISNGLHFYEGNSILTPYVMLKKNVE